MSGFFTLGFPTIKSGLSQSARVPVDTGAVNTPQSGGLIPGSQVLSSAAVTAHAGGGKASATALGYGVTEITVCATAANSVLLPYAFPGSVAIVSNDGATSTTVFGQGTDTIDGVATATGNAMAAAKRAIFYGIAGTGDGTDAGAWVSCAGAKIS